MIVGVTGGCGFLGRYIVNRLLREGHRCRCWFREGSDRGGFFEGGKNIEWVEGVLGSDTAVAALVAGVDAVVHAAVSWEGAQDAALGRFAEVNLLGSLRLMEAARAAEVERFVFIATCGVHEVILDDRALDEAHPLWPTHHYGAYKAAMEKFVHSYGLGQGWNVCSLRPTGIYGLRRPAKLSRWYRVVRDVVRGKDIKKRAGGKEVHAEDCAAAVSLLLQADGIAGQAYNCYDLYVADQDVAQIAKEITGSASEIALVNRGCVHQIDTGKIERLGMTFGGRELLEEYVRELVALVREE